MDSHESRSLDAFLDRELPEIVATESTHFDHLIGDRLSSIILYGCGKLGRKIARTLRSLGIQPQGFVDANPALHGKLVDDIPVYSLGDAATEFGQTAAFIYTLWSPGKDRLFHVIKKNMEDAGCTRVLHFLPLFWKRPDLFLPHYRLDLPSRILAHRDEVAAAYHLYEDAVSRHEYFVQLHWMVYGDTATVPAAEPLESQYFPEGLPMFGENEFFVDCGAYDGDTLNAVIQRSGGAFRGMVAYEPDPDNYRKLQDYVQSLSPAIQAKIRLRKSAVGSCTGWASFSAMGNPVSNLAPDGEIRVKVNTLDKDLSSDIPTYIKMDIEGGETDALAGAKNIIQAYHPKLAICVYHIQDHFWRIPLYLKQLAPDYRLFLRRHGDEFGDLVCYAIPKDICKS